MFIGALVAALAVVLAGGLLASNMGFKLNYTLIAQGQAVPEGGVSQDGTNDLSLPDFPQSGMVTANDLRLDIGAPANGGIARFLRSTNTLQTYTGKGAVANYNLVAGDGYRVRVTGGTSVNYIIVGSHNPSLSHVLIAAGQAFLDTSRAGPTGRLGIAGIVGLDHFVLRNARAGIAGGARGARRCTRYETAGG
jgi:hypothetical protein